MGKVGVAFLSGLGLFVAPSDNQVLVISLGVWVGIIILAVLLSIRHDRKAERAWEYEAQYDRLQEEEIERLSREAEAGYDVSWFHHHDHRRGTHQRPPRWKLTDNDPED